MAIAIEEIERKYEAPPGTPLPPLEDLPKVAAESDPDEQILEAEYYDAPDLRLLREGITLRRRRGGSDPGWHLKLPTGDDSRREIRLPLGSGRGKAAAAVPEELAALVRVHTRGQPLRPVAIIRTKRQRRLLLDEAGASLAELVADDVSAETLGDSTTISRWHEVEVELTGGDRELLRAADERLQRSGLRPAGHSAKLERALAGQLPEPGPPQELTARSPASEPVLAYLRTYAGTLKSMDPMVRRQEPDSVHQMRVATRRLRSTLQSFGKIISRPDTRRLEAELRWLGGVLGEARDAEVLAARFEARIRQMPPELLLGPVQARIRAHFAPLEAATHTALLEALDSPRYFSLLDTLDEVLLHPPLTDKAAGTAGSVLPRLVRRTYRRVDQRMDRAQQVPVGQAREVPLHETRKAAKRARYAGEAASLALGRGPGQFAGQMKHVQSLLGDHQDATIARSVTRDIGISAHLAGENAFSHGLLYDREDQDSLRLQQQAPSTWKRASRAKYRRWMS